MSYDFKKECREYYLPDKKPQVVTLPKTNYLAVRGSGDPNDENGAYKAAIAVLYAIAYTLKMSYKTDHRISGFYDYVVPPLEGLWWQEGVDGIDYSDKSTYCWISLIRLPDFVQLSDFLWAKETAEKKKRMDCAAAEFISIEEGLCVQIMHIGPFDDEPASIKIMDQYLDANGYEYDFSPERQHHEIYLSDVRKMPREKWKTVIRHPIKPKSKLEQ